MRPAADNSKSAGNAGERPAAHTGCLLPVSTSIPRIRVGSKRRGCGGRAPASVRLLLAQITISERDDQIIRVRTGTGGLSELSKFPSVDESLQDVLLDLEIVIGNGLEPFAQLR